MGSGYSLGSGVATSSTVGGAGMLFADVATTGVKGETGKPSFLMCANLPCCKAGDLLDGTVLLLPRPPDVGVVTAGLPGLGAPLDARERLEDVDLLRRIFPSLDTLSAPALAFDADLWTPDFRDELGVAGALITGVPF
jgi:hypothetical protein